MKFENFKAGNKLNKEFRVISNSYYYEESKKANSRKCRNGLPESDGLGAAEERFLQKSEERVRGVVEGKKSGNEEYDRWVVD
nr:hypothetical protein Iba_chr09fCG6790 [Ipomoea batatas]